MDHLTLPPFQAAYLYNHRSLGWRIEFAPHLQTPRRMERQFAALDRKVDNVEWQSRKNRRQGVRGVFAVANRRIRGSQRSPSLEPAAAARPIVHPESQRDAGFASDPAEDRPRPRQMADDPVKPPVLTHF